LPLIEKLFYCKQSVQITFGFCALPILAC